MNTMLGARTEPFLGQTRAFLERDQAANERLQAVREPPLLAPQL